MLAHRLLSACWCINGLFEAPKRIPGAWLACVIVESCARDLCADNTSAPAFPIGCFLLEHVVDNFGQFVGRGRRGFGRPEFTAHAAKKGPEIAGARAETLRRHAQGATGPILDPSTARGEHFAATDLIVGTEPQPGGKMFVGRPFMHIEAHLCEDDMDRRGL